MIDYDKIKTIIEKNEYGKVLENIYFKNITTLKIGGKIRLFYYPNNIESLIKVYKIIKDNNLKYFIIGNGSNILASDKEYEGIVISLKEIDFKYKLDNDKIIVSSGIKVSHLIVSLMKQNIGGLEFLIGIPGTIGGLVCMNAGAYKHEIKDIIIDVKILDENGNIKIYKKEELDFKYRSSLIKEKKWIIIECSLRIIKREKEEIKNHLIKYLLFRKNNQPLNNYNAGCTFKNSNVSSWKLIDEVGLRGYKIGDAQVSTKHSNFLINIKNAKCKEMLELIKCLQEKIKKEKNIDLECEWVFIE